MKQLISAKAFILLCTLLSFGAVPYAQNATSSYFEGSTLAKIIEHRECAGVRFYNVIEPTTGKSSTMAIGVRVDESEIFNFSNRYYVFKKSIEGGIEYSKLSQRKAALACEKVKANGEAVFSASFSKEDIESMLSTAPLGGVIVQQKKTESLTIFEAQSGSVMGGSFVPSANSRAMVSGEPCPTFCGNSLNYVHMQ
ncbi:MAG: hypothetical protein AB8F78_13550 [Saprospiraceae bacterium]